jgi:hypothetical protein
MTTEPAVLTLPQAARRLGLSTEDTLDLMLSRDLPVTLDATGDVGVSVEAIDEWRQAHAS